MTIQELQEKSYRHAIEKGFWGEVGTKVLPQIDQKLLLTVSEICEAQDALRDHPNPSHTFAREKDGKPEGFVFELADAVIRIADLCGALGLNLEHAIVQKMAFNRTRPHMHGRRF